MSSGGVIFESAVPGLEFTGEPITELGWAIAFGNEGCKISPPDPELIVRCGGLRGAEEDIIDGEPAGAGESGSATPAAAPAVDGRSWSTGVMGRRGIGSLLLIVCDVCGTGEEVGERCRSSQVRSSFVYFEVSIAYCMSVQALSMPLSCESFECSLKVDVAEWVS